MKTKSIFLLGFLVAFFSFQTTFGTPIKFDENLDDTITIKTPGKFPCTVPLKKGPICCEMRPDGNVNVYYRDGSHSIIVYDQSNPKRVEEYDSKNIHTKKMFFNAFGEVNKEESYDKRGKVNGETKYGSRMDGTDGILETWKIDKNGNKIKKNYEPYSFDFYIDNRFLLVEVEDKFGNTIKKKEYVNGILVSVTYYSDGKPDYKEHTDGEIERFDKYGNLIKETDKPEDSSTISKNFIDDIFSLGTKKDKVDTGSEKTKVDTDGIVGTWEKTLISEDRKTTLTYTFHPDGTLTTYEVCTGGENFTNSEKGKYEVQGNVLKIWYLEELGSKPSTSDFRIEGDKLILVSEYGWESIFTRKN